MMSGGLGEPKPWGGGSFVRDRFSLRFRVFFLYFSDVSKLPFVCLSCGPVFIGKMLHGS
jgi:hypothetical protein